MCCSKSNQYSSDILMGYVNKNWKGVFEILWIDGIASARCVYSRCSQLINNQNLCDSRQSWSGRCEQASSQHNIAARSRVMNNHATLPCFNTTMIHTAANRWNKTLWNIALTDHGHLFIHSEFAGYLFIHVSRKEINIWVSLSSSDIGYSVIT